MKRTLAALLLAGCASTQAVHTAQMSVGKTADDLVMCMGIPAKTTTPADGDDVMQWSYEEKSPSVNLPLADMALLPITIGAKLAGQASLGGIDGTCQAIATLHAGQVIGFVYTGDSDSISGPYAVCQPLTLGCLGVWTAQAAR